MIITKISALEFTPEILRNGGLVIILSYFIIFLQIIIGKLSARILKLPEKQAVIHILHMFLGNIVFLGFPLLDALFPGGEAILYAALYQLVMNTVLWSYGVFKLNPGSHEKGLKSLKKMLNPNTIALCIGLIMMILHLRLPYVLHQSLGGLGNTTLYLAMIYIGILLAKAHFFEIVRNPDVILLSVQKLFIIPILLLVIFYFLFLFSGLKINDIAFSVLILEASMPCMTILVILARRYGADDRKAMENFVISTLLSVLSLPLISYLIGQVLAM